MHVDLQQICNKLINSLGGVRLSPLGTPAAIGSILSAPGYDEDECAAVGGMTSGRGTEVLGENLLQWHFVMAHMTGNGMESRPPWWGAGFIAA
jgi:hypothetical protein